MESKVDRALGNILANGRSRLNGVQSGPSSACQNCSGIHFGDALLARALFAKAGALRCVRTVSKPYLFWRLGLAFERKANAPSYCK